MNEEILDEFLRVSVSDDDIAKLDSLLAELSSGTIILNSEQLRKALPDILPDVRKVCLAWLGMKESVLSAKQRRDELDRFKSSLDETLAFLAPGGIDCELERRLEFLVAQVYQPVDWIDWLSKAPARGQRYELYESLSSLRTLLESIRNDLSESGRKPNNRRQMLSNLLWYVFLSHSLEPSTTRTGAFMELFGRLIERFETASFDKSGNPKWGDGQSEASESQQLWSRWIQDKENQLQAAADSLAEHIRKLTPDFAERYSKHFLTALEVRKQYENKIQD